MPSEARLLNEQTRCHGTRVTSRSCFIAYKVKLSNWEFAEYVVKKLGQRTKRPSDAFDRGVLENSHVTTRVSVINIVQYEEADYIIAGRSNQHDLCAGPQRIQELIGMRRRTPMAPANRGTAVSGEIEISASIRWYERSKARVADSHAVTGPRFTAIAQVRGSPIISYYKAALNVTYAASKSPWSKYSGKAPVSW